MISNCSCCEFSKEFPFETLNPDIGLHIPKLDSWHTSSTLLRLRIMVRCSYYVYKRRTPGMTHYRTPKVGYFSFRPFLTEGFPSLYSRDKGWDLEFSITVECCEQAEISFPVVCQSQLSPGVAEDLHRPCWSIHPMNLRLDCTANLYFDAVVVCPVGSHEVAPSFSSMRRIELRYLYAYFWMLYVASLCYPNYRLPSVNLFLTSPDRCRKWYQKKSR